MNKKLKLKASEAISEKFNVPNMLCLLSFFEDAWWQSLKYKKTVVFSIWTIIWSRVHSKDSDLILCLAYPSFGMNSLFGLLICVAFLV